MERINMTMLTDFYELTMANGYFENGMRDQIAYFDMFFRKNPDDGGFAIMAGLEQLVHCLEKMKFEEEDIEYLRSKKIFSEDFLNYLREFKFECDLWAFPEGTPVFPGEPLITVRGPIIQAQFIETILLLIINHQSLIATKANRIVRAAEGRGVMEFGTRRAHGASSAIYGARAAYIGGCVGTACAIAGRDLGVNALGTMAHSWVQMFDSEYEAFKTYARLYPDNCTLLVDTYNVLKSGIPNAIKVFKEMDIKNKAIRIDSGDITYLTKRGRKMLDDAGLHDCKIVVSSSLDEYIIRDVLSQGACVDSFGVGERLITAKSDPVFGGVYKLAAVEKNGTVIPKMKISENIGKITNPGFKTVYRLYDKDSGKAIADVITLDHETIPEGDDYEIFDPHFIWNRKKVSNFKAVNLRKQIFDKGKLVYKLPTLNQIREYCKEQIGTLWEEILRFENPHEYYVDLSKELWELKERLILEYKNFNVQER
ncbi:MAG: nicotinate phosphoribosyltransferase [Clostridiales bacterium]|nr:nicotinate phosphoribosyltransferase [Clostridiales bacterium]